MIGEFSIPLDRNIVKSFRLEGNYFRFSSALFVTLLACQISDGVLSFLRCYFMVCAFIFPVSLPCFPC